MPKEIKVGRLFRDFPATDIKITRDAGKPVALSFSISSEMPIERFFGTEVLSHDKGAIRMERVNGGAVPLLFNHNWDDPIGMVDNARVVDNRLVMDAHLFATARAAEVQTMIDGGLRNTSLGYQMHSIEEEVKTNTYTARDWEPLEASIVTVPADPSVGIGRANDDEAKPVRVIGGEPPAAPAKSEGVRTMEVKDDTKAGAPADTKVENISAVEAEKERRQAIINLCKSNRIDSRVQERWIAEGTALSKIASELLEVMEERGKSEPVSASALGLSTKDTKRYSLFRAIRAQLYGAQQPDYIREAAFEIECTKQVAKQLGRDGSRNILVPGEILTRAVGAEAATRAMATTPGSKGGYMVGVEVMGFIDILRNRSVALRMGARQLSGLTGNVIFPRQTGKVTVTWQAGEGTSVTAADQALGQLSMTPKTCIAITDVSEQLLRQATPSAEAFVMADLAADVAIDGVDAAVINGTGGAQPLGIKNTTGVTTGQDAASATYAKVLAFVSTAGASNAIRGNPGFVTNTAGAAKLMTVQRFTSTDSPVWTGNMLDGQLVGFNAMSSEQLASGNLIFGSWDEVVIGDWGVLELATDTGGTRFNQAQVGIRALWMVDVLVRYPQAFVVSTNLS